MQKHAISNSNNSNLVRLVQSVRLPPQKISMVAVQVDRSKDYSQMLVAPSPEFCDDDDIFFGESLVRITAEGHVFMIFTV